MLHPKPMPVESFENLRARVERLIRTQVRRPAGTCQASLNLFDAKLRAAEINVPSKNIGEFLDLLTAALPDGDAYLFGGILRDMALFGKRGFDSDIDIVVEGAWSNCVTYLERLGAEKNKFGGYRLRIGEWPVDIWNAKDTWAIKEGFVQYKGISSLTETTVLNWDAILMSWRTKAFIAKNGYLDDLRDRVLGVVLEENPNPLGMAVRVLRHFFLKDAAQVTERAARYLINCARTYSYDEIVNSEFASYQNSVIQEPLYRFFSHLTGYEELDLHRGFSIAGSILKMELELSGHRTGS